jgi:hypothetical protein
MSTSLSRLITHDPALLAGRWHLAGTQIAVAEVRLDFAAWRGRAEHYRYPGVSAVELENCLTFTFPPVRESNLSLLSGVVIISCACGEDTAAVGPLDAPVQCVCGRRWRIDLRLIPLEEAGVPTRLQVVPVESNGLCTEIAD